MNYYLYDSRKKNNLPRHLFFNKLTTNKKNNLSLFKFKFMSTKGLILKAFALLFLVGGVIKVFATQSTFISLRIGYFWVDNDYFIFVNRIMGGVLILSGALFWSISKDLQRFRYVLGGYSFGLLTLAVIIGISGYMLHLSLFSYIADVILFSVMGLFCLYIRS